ncbi:MAG: S49 family peptidase [Burkholderiales bacterium PBB5]|nr:MAG: S49 family peptidase [Burkholderiales bacterium PBB5]
MDQSLVFRAAFKDLLLDRKAERRSKGWRAVLYFLMFVLPAGLYWGFYAWSSGGLRFGGGDDAVAVIRIEGEIADGNLASANRVIPTLRKAFEAERVKAIVLSIESPGGAPLEAERIYTALESWRQRHPKPVVAVINNLGASAAYMVALHADRIYAGNYSLVGSVGAILSGWDAHEALGRVGVSQRVYASGELKAMMNPYLPMSPEAEHKARDLVNTMGKAFRAELVALRKDKLADGIDFGSGAVWGGAEAKRIGLIDEVATIDQVVKTRWPDLVVDDMGPRSGGLPFAAAAASWMGEVIAASTARLRADVSLR